MWYIRTLISLLIISTILLLWNAYRIVEISENTHEYLKRQNYLLQIQLEEKDEEIQRIWYIKAAEGQEELIDYSTVRWEDQPAR